MCFASKCFHRKRLVSVVCTHVRGASQTVFSIRIALGPATNWKLYFPNLAEYTQVSVPFGSRSRFSKLKSAKSPRKLKYIFSLSLLNGVGTDVFLLSAHGDSRVSKQNQISTVAYEKRKKRKVLNQSDKKKTTWYIIGHVEFVIHIDFDLDVEVRVPVGALEEGTVEHREKGNGGLHSEGRSKPLDDARLSFSKKLYISRSCCRKFAFGNRCCRKFAFENRCCRNFVLYCT